MGEGEVLLGLEPMLADMVRYFCWRNHHLDADELMGEARLVALRALRSYDPTRGAALRSWVWTRFSSYLRSYAVSKAWHRRHARSAAYLPPMPRSKEFDADLLKSEISPLAARAVAKALECETKGGVISFLVKELGLEREQVQKVFEEVREAMGL